MDRVAIGDDGSYESAVAAAVGVLRRGGIVAYPTDTLYGLAVDPRSEEAVERLFRVKGRSQSSAIPLIAATTSQAMDSGRFGRLASRIAHEFWPGPLSIVTPASPTIARAVLAGGVTIAVRVPDHPLARTLAARFGFALTSTSANRSGSPATASPDDVAASLGDDIDLLIDAGETRGGPVSTIVDTCDDELVLLRAGAVPWERIQKIVR